MKDRHLLLRHQSLVLSAIAVTISFSIMGCTTAQEPITSKKSESTATTSPTRTSETSTTPSPTQTSVSIDAAQQDRTCSNILSADSLYELDPNLTAGNPPGLPSGTYATQAQTLGGSGCTILNTNTGQEIQVYITKLTPSSAKQMALQIESIKTTSKKYEASIGVTGAYSADSSTGTAQFMNKDYWVIIAEPLPGGNVNTARLSNLIYTALQ